MPMEHQSVSRRRVNALFYILVDPDERFAEGDLTH